MERLYAVILAISGILLLLRMFNQARRGEVDVFSTRNFFLVGYIIFILNSGIFTLGFDFYPQVQLRAQTPATSGAIYVIIALLYLVLFMRTYTSGFLADRFANKVNLRFSVDGPIAMLVLAGALLILSVTFKFGLGQLQFVGVLTQTLAIGMAAGAAALAAWAWAPRPFNAVVGTLAAAVILLAMGLALYKAFGRRDVLSVMLAALWGAHYGHWRHIGIKRSLHQIIPVGAAGLVALASFTGARTLTEGAHLGFVESFRRVTQGDVGEGLLQMGAQDTAACSLWLIETRPDPFPYDTLHSLRYFLAHPIPRVFWENKPTGIGLAMVDQAGVKQKAKGFNFGPGMCGHVMNDNPWVSLIPYALGIAVMLRFMDRMIGRYPFNPFVVVPMGVAVGEILALARGELGLFMVRTVASSGGVWIAMWFCATIGSAMGIRSSAAPTGAPAEPESVIDPDLAAAYGESDDLGDNAESIA